MRDVDGWDRRKSVTEESPGMFDVVLEEVLDSDTPTDDA